MKNYFGEIGLLIVAIIWGSGFVASDISLTYFTPYETLSIRFCVASICLLVVFFRKLKGLTTATLKYGIILGIILYGAFMLQTVGLVYTTPSKNAFLTSINVVIVPFISFAIYKRRLDAYGAIGAFLSILGIGIISLKSDLTINFGDFLTIMCAVGFAFHIFFTSEFIKKETDAAALTLVQMVTATVISLFALIFVGGEKTTGFSETALISALYLGLFSTTIAFLLQTICQKHTTETKAAVLMSTESLFGAIFSVIILKEALTLRTGFGCVIIFIAILTAELKPGLKYFSKAKKNPGGIGENGYY